MKSRKIRKKLPMLTFCCWLFVVLLCSVPVSKCQEDQKSDLTQDEAERREGKPQDSATGNNNGKDILAAMIATSPLDTLQNIIGCKFAQQFVPDLSF